MSTDADLEAVAVSPDVLRQEIDTTIALVEASDIDLAYMFLGIIDRAPRSDRPALLHYLAENFWDRRQSTGEIKPSPIISTTERESLQQRYSNVCDGIFELILRDNPHQDEFYERLYELTENPIFNSQNARAFVLFWLLIDTRMPYFNLEPGLRMSAEDWRHLGQVLRTKRARIRFILASSERFDQRSEEADLIMREIDEVLEPNGKVRLLAFVIWHLKQETRRLAQELGRIQI